MSRGRIAPSAPAGFRRSSTTDSAPATEPSASCRSTTRWASTRCSPRRWSAVASSRSRPGIPTRALELIEREHVDTLYLAPTLFYDLVHHPQLGDVDTSSVRAVAYAGAPMTSALVERVAEAFDPEIFVNHYGSTEIYTFSVQRNQRAKPAAPVAPR